MCKFILLCVKLPRWDYQRRWFGRHSTPLVMLSHRNERERKSNWKWFRLIVNTTHAHTSMMNIIAMNIVSRRIFVLSLLVMFVIPHMRGLSLFCVVFYFSMFHSSMNISHELINFLSLNNSIFSRPKLLHILQKWYNRIFKNKCDEFKLFLGVGTGLAHFTLQSNITMHIVKR